MVARMSIHNKTLQWFLQCHNVYPGMQCLAGRHNLMNQTELAARPVQDWGSPERASACCLSQRKGWEVVSTELSVVYHWMHHIAKFTAILLIDKIFTTKDDNHPIIYRVLTIPGGAGFLPSTVWQNATLPEFHSSPLKSERAPIGKYIVLKQPPLFSGVSC